ncbi:MAG: RloB family protein [Rickettsiales bacterium]|jgi:hypothetical protein|nr:RloB family protein [Rickettsiales bacterium]
MVKIKKSKQNKRCTKKFFHLFFNGAVAEPQYFANFNNLSANFVIKLYKVGNDKSESPWQLIDRAIETKLKLEPDDKDDDQFWCIFDIDDYFTQNKDKFTVATKEAEKHKINLGFSNRCFELWYLLHFEYCDTAMSCKDYDKKLKQYFKKNNFNYKKNANVFKILQIMQKNAIKNGENLALMNSNFYSNPSTNIFNLVKKLNENLR